MFSVKQGNRFQLAAITYFILGNLVFGIILGFRGGDVGIIPSLLVSQLILVGGALAAYVLIYPVDPVKDLFIKKINPIDGLICVGIAWMIMPFLSAINVMSQFFVQNQIQDALIQMIELPYLITLLLTAVSPAILEELLSRSIILRNYHRQPVLVTCTISGIFFGFIHLNINQFLYAFVMGAVMCYIIMITDSVLSAMIVHFTINATGTTTLYISKWLLNQFDDTGALLEDMMSTAVPTTAELAVSLFSISVAALFFTPVAGILINMLLKRNGKQYSGSLKMITSEFIGRPAMTLTHSFSEELSEQESNSTYVPEPPEERVVTLSLILTGLSFAAFAILLELAG